jgi:hypothetical protein
VPAPPLANSLEGQATGTTITNANSGGGSGDAFTTVTNPGGSHVIAFSDEQNAHGNNAMKIYTPSASPAATRVDWTGLGGGSANIWFRLYLYRVNNPPSGQHIFGGVRDSAAALSAQIRVSTAGLIRVENAAAAFITALDATVAMRLNQWVRIEWRILSSATVGEFEWRLFNDPESANVTETKSATGQALAANSDQIRVGVVTNPIASDLSYYDDLAVSTVDWIGPSTNPLESSVGFVPHSMPKGV